MSIFKYRKISKKLTMTMKPLTMDISEQRQLEKQLSRRGPQLASNFLKVILFVFAVPQKIPKTRSQNDKLEKEDIDMDIA